MELYKRIIENGAVISEFPLGTRADKQCFPIRNRIVSGLSVATLVVESDIRGGSMITARLAGEQGRDVFAIPGRIDSSSSRGCHALIRDGVTLASSPEDIIQSLSFSGQIEFALEGSAPAKESAPKAQSINLSGDEAAVFACFKNAESLGVDAISEASGLPVSKCLAALLMLEIKKILSKNPGGTWSRRG